MKIKKVLSVIFLLTIVYLSLYGLAIVKSFYPFPYKEQVYKYAIKYDVDPYIVAGVIKAESSFNARAKSHKNAYGLMQITDSTGEWAAKEMKLEGFTAEKLYEPEFNINMGCWYLHNLKDEFKGNMDLVLAAYNGGRGNVQKWLKDRDHSKDGENLHYIPFKETDQYVKRVKTNYHIYKFLYDKKK